jgi:peroxiredoxin
MKYKIPQLISLVFSLTGVLFLYLNYPVAAQTFFVLAFLTGIGAFKKYGCMDSAAVHVLSAVLMGYFYFSSAAFPFLSIAVILSSLQNPFLELFFPSKMYNTRAFKITISLISISCYLTGNILYPAGWQAWLFPGLMLLFANLLTFLIIADVKAITAASRKGYIQTGSPCPDFSLPDETGKIISKKDFEGKFLLMVFVRGDWCPGCHITLRTYERNKEKFAECGVQLLSIGPDPLGVNKEMVEKLGLSYHVLADDKQMLARQFCVELQDKAKGVPKDYDFVPLPASFLIDKQGIVRYTSRADKAGEILNPALVFEVLDSLK